MIKILKLLANSLCMIRPYYRMSGGENNEQSRNKVYDITSKKSNF